MPTINKQMNANSNAQTVDTVASLLLTLPGFTEISGTLVNKDGVSMSSSHIISVDGRVDVCFFTCNYDNYPCYGIAKRQGDSYVLFHYKSGSPSGGTWWMRCYTASSSSSERLITISRGNIPGKDPAYANDWLVGKDIEDNTLYGFGLKWISGLYCPETDIYVNLDAFLLTKATYDWAVPEHFADKAILSKAVNLCHPNLIEMKHLYTATLRPKVYGNSENAAQRFLISSSLWGFSNGDEYSDVSAVFDPALKI